MTRILWITGRAATGKSTLVTELDTRLRAAGVTPYRLCDEDLLLALTSADHQHAHHRHPAGDPARFVPTSGYLFDQGLRIISRRLLRLIDASAEVVLVEAARGRSAPVDVSYRRTLDLIDPRVWDHSFVFRLDTPLDVQITRNQQRLARTGHGTPEAILLDLYDQDDPAAFVRAGIPVTTLPTDDPKSLAERVLRTAGLRPRSATGYLDAIGRDRYVPR